MVKVIENCVKKKRVRCCRCHSLLEYEPQDVKARTLISTTFYIHCPCCGAETILSVNDRERYKKFYG